MTRRNWFYRFYCSALTVFGHDWAYEDVINGGVYVKYCQRCGELRWCSAYEVRRHGGLQMRARA